MMHSNLTIYDLHSVVYLINHDSVKKRNMDYNPKIVGS